MWWGDEKERETMSTAMSLIILCAIIGIRLRNEAGSVEARS